MSYRQFAVLVIALIGLLDLSGCASRAPTISHIHIGHALDGWPDTPNQAGLFVTAERAAAAAEQAASAAVAQHAELDDIKVNVSQALKSTNPDYFIEDKSKEEKEYGVKNALAEAAHHIIFAAESPDASDTIRKSAQSFSNNADYVINRCDLITALGGVILKSESVQEAQLLSQELHKLVLANRDGDDSDGDGVPGSSPEEYGLKQLRNQLQRIVDREDPPYTTVSNWYLFNLVRLPSGEWILRKLTGAGDSGQTSGY